ncbi:MAG: hypothetical protein DRP29_03015 [Thermodesulfobacteriota bacterium]|nr:MAG: hypothetical protein DRP29_03015 [Thermodesulfobacteriota bacterium]
MPARSKYRLGRKLEYRIKKLLEEHGYEVIRSAGSHGRWDLVAIKDRIVRLIQVKKGKVQKHKVINLMPLLAQPALLIKEAWFYIPRGGIKIVRNDGMDWNKILITDAEEDLKHGSCKSNR